MSRALIFDFDGLTLDTESATFAVWRSVYRREGVELTLPTWLQAVGHVGNFDPHAHLEEMTGRRHDHAALDAEIRALLERAVADLPPMPGVEALMRVGREMGWRIGVASNSDSAWVRGGLAASGLAPLVEAVCTRDDVANPKPAPDVYRAVLAALDAAPESSIAFEDSRPGVLAAKAAGLHVVAVPNTLTRHSDLSPADERLATLVDYQLEKGSRV